MRNQERKQKHWGTVLSVILLALSRAVAMDIAHWKMEEVVEIADNALIKNEAENRNVHLVDLEVTALVAGLGHPRLTTKEQGSFGRALFFDQAYAAAQGIWDGYDSIEIDVWIKLDQLPSETGNNMYLMETDAWHLLILADGNRLEWRVNHEDGGNRIRRIGLGDCKNRWIHVVASLRDGVSSLTVDGQTTSASSAPMRIVRNATLHLGHRPGKPAERAFRGMMDEIKISIPGHNHVLNVAEAREPMNWAANTGEILYNGIRLPAQWPPRYINPEDRSPMPVPYLDYPPEVIHIDVGRQLLFDDFLIEQTDLKRSFHSPVKYEGNPVLQPETELEKGRQPAAFPLSGGVWWDYDEKMFKMWYSAQFQGRICYATSADGIHWDRPDLGIVPGSNVSLETRPDYRPDSFTVVPDWDAARPDERWTLFVRPPGGAQHGYSYVSPDGIAWKNRTATGSTHDRTTHFFNPFRNKWVYSLRTTALPGRNRVRARQYYETEDFLRGARWGEEDKVAWLLVDENDPADNQTGEEPQLYNFDAVAYESILLGFYAIHHGPPNIECHRAGLPKITELNFAYSRDGFHVHRPDRIAHIPAERRDVWDRAYIQSVGGICVVMGDELWFYYSGFSGNEAMGGEEFERTRVSGAYYGGSTGIAILRRDGFASLDAGPAGGRMTTRPLRFSGRRLFVNADVPEGRIRAELRDAENRPIEPFTLDASIPFAGDSTITELRWASADDFSTLAGQPVRIHFEVTNGSLYSFWVSKDGSGRSDGYVAAGGPGYTGPVDTVGKQALEYRKENR